MSTPSKYRRRLLKRCHQSHIDDEFFLYPIRSTTSNTLPIWPNAILDCLATSRPITSGNYSTIEIVPSIIWTIARPKMVSFRWARENERLCEMADCPAVGRLTLHINHRIDRPRISARSERYQEVDRLSHRWGRNNN